MQITKEELEKILDELKIPVAEGINKDTDANVFPRIVFWEYFWEFLQASSKTHNTLVTYQISYFSKIPRDPNLLTLISKLLDYGIVPEVSHEYIQEDKYFHSFFKIDVLENVISLSE